MRSLWPSLALSLALLSPALTPAAAQCRGGSCLAPPVAPPAAPAPAPAPAWIESPSDPGRLYLYRGAVQLGGYDRATGVYRPLLDYQSDLWGEPAAPPVSVPEEPRRELNFGVDRSKLHDGARYQLNGRDVSRREAHRSLEKGIADDSGKLRLTVIGSPEERSRVLQDVPAELEDKVNVWSVAPDHWSMKDNVTGAPIYVTSGHPTVYLQAPDGKVLHRQDGYQPGDMQAIRKAAGYDPSKDPDVRRPASGSSLPLQLLGGGGVALVVLLALQHLIHASRNIHASFRS